MSNPPVFYTPPPNPQPLPPRPDAIFNEPPDPALLNLPAVSYPLIPSIGHLRQLLPPNWFADDDPVLDAILATFADTINDITVRNDWVYTQDRLTTATGVWLDMYAEELFGVGGWMYRRINEGDAPFRRRLRFEVLCQRATKQAMKDSLNFWCSREPTVIEPWNPTDTGTWDGGNMFWDQTGRWGSTSDPYTAFIIASRAGVVPMQFWNDKTKSDFLVQTPGLINGNPVSTTNFLVGGWDHGSIFWTGADFNQSIVTDQDVYDVVNRTKPVGTKGFVHLSDSAQLSNNPDQIILNILNYNFKLNASKLSSLDDIIRQAGNQVLLGVTFILGQCILGVTTVLNNLPPHGFVSTYLDLNFVLNKSALSSGSGPTNFSGAPPQFYPLPGRLAGDGAPGDLPFFTDVNASM